MNTLRDDLFAPIGADLRGAAARLREKTVPERQRGAPPEENGVRLATIRRSEDEELRLAWAEYNGAHFLNIRLWKRFELGWWPEKGKGLTVRRRELAGFAEGVAKAVDMAAGEEPHGA